MIPCTYLTIELSGCLATHTVPQVAEEQRLRAEKASALEAVRERVREEEEEEEAQLMEAKADMLRKLKQQVVRGEGVALSCSRSSPPHPLPQVASEQEAEERELREKKEKALQQLQKELKTKQVLAITLLGVPHSQHNLHLN